MKKIDKLQDLLMKAQDASQEAWYAASDCLPLGIRPGILKEIDIAIVALSRAFRYTVERD